MITQVPAEIMEYAPWSPSKLSTALSCPYAFSRQYVKGERSTQEGTADNRVGTAVHSILEWTMRGVALDKAYAHVVEACPLTQEDILTVRTYRGAIVDFLKRMQQFQEKYKPIIVGLEVPIAMDAKFEPTNYWGKKVFIRGKIDLFIMTNKLEALVLDHKSGAVSPLDRHTRQLETYALGIYATHPKLRAVRSAVHFVGADPDPTGSRTVWNPNVYTPEQLQTQCREDLIESLQTALKMIPTAEPIVSWKCKYCGYDLSCPAKS